MPVPGSSDDGTESHECSHRLKVIEREEESDEAVSARSSICIVDDRHDLPRACPLSEHDPGTAIVHAPSYVGIKYSDELTIIQITCKDTRTVDQKKTLDRMFA
jgi:hypothetical protein